VACPERRGSSSLHEEDGYGGFGCGNKRVKHRRGEDAHTTTKGLSLSLSLSLSLIGNVRGKNDTSHPILGSCTVNQS